jgi:hypothetical protein
MGNRRSSPRTRSGQLCAAEKLSPWLTHGVLIVVLVYIAYLVSVGMSAESSVALTAAAGLVAAEIARRLQRAAPTYLSSRSGPVAG